MARDPRYDILFEPVKIGVIAMLINMVLNVAFVVPMVMLGFQGPHTGLALATRVSVGSHGIW